MIGHATLPDPDGGPQHPDRPGLVEARQPLPFAGPKRVGLPGIAFEDAAADRHRAGHPQSLRPSRPRDASTASARSTGRTSSRRSATTRSSIAPCRRRDQSRGVRLGRPRAILGDGVTVHARAAATLVGARHARPATRRCGRAFVLETPAGKHLSHRRHRLRRRHPLPRRRAKSTAPSASPSCRSAPTSHAGS